MYVIRKTVHWIVWCIEWMNSGRMLIKMDFVELYFISTHTHGHVASASQFYLYTRWWYVECTNRFSRAMTMYHFVVYLCLCCIYGSMLICEFLNCCFNCGSQLIHTHTYLSMYNSVCCRRPFSSSHHHSLSIAKHIKQ